MARWEMVEEGVAGGGGKRMERLEFRMRRKRWLRRQSQSLGTEGFLVVARGRIYP